MCKGRALFLDRDGVINIRKPYIYLCKDFQFQDGIFELCRAAQRLSYLLVVVTNQAGIARGYYTEAEFLELTQWMSDRFAERHVRIARVYYCPFHPAEGLGKYKCESPDRKPNPGMLLRAREELNLDLGKSVLIGDQMSDVQAATAAGVGTKILLSSGAEGIESGNNHFCVLHSLDEVRRKVFPAHALIEKSRI